MIKILYISKEIKNTASIIFQSNFTIQFITMEGMNCYRIVRKKEVVWS
jgi:hypothetical protein